MLLKWTRQPEEVTQCQEATEQDHEVRDHGMAAAVDVRPVPDRQENAYALYAEQLFNINGDIRALSRAVRAAGRA